MKNPVVAVLALSAVFMFVSLQGTSAGEDKDARKLFEKKCSICHSVKRPKSKRKTKPGWKETVMRMKDVNRAPISNKQARIIIDYLAENYGK